MSRAGGQRFSTVKLRIHREVPRDTKDRIVASRAPEVARGSRLAVSKAKRAQGDVRIASVELPNTSYCALIPICRWDTHEAAGGNKNGCCVRPVANMQETGRGAEYAVEVILGQARGGLGLGLLNYLVTANGFSIRRRALTEHCTEYNHNYNECWSTARIAIQKWLDIAELKALESAAGERQLPSSGRK
ncbi:hypothetical protein H100_03824 [Trichophyton rubrum MR850]|nr:hypothetical protein H100_03824 [Trichophyton rubrum MR850]